MELTIGNVDFQCTDFSELGGWVSGLVAHNYTFPSGDVYKIRFVLFKDFVIIFYPPFYLVGLFAVFVLHEINF